MNSGSEESQKALNLLKTARGQIEGIVRMIEQGEYCVDVSKQLLSVSAIIKKANTTILKQHMNTCVKEALAHGGAEAEIKLAEVNTILDSYIS